MFNDDFESAFGNFLESREYDQAEEALYSMARRGFIAGWRAAGGHVMASQSIMNTKTKYDIPHKPTKSKEKFIQFPPKE